MSFRQLIQNAILLAGLIALPGSALASGVPTPLIPKANAQATGEYGCVAPVDHMRKNHMKELLHQRDATLREGIRTEQFNLAECINCHVTPAATGQVARYGEDEHFCSSCHNYTSVKIDCFTCHTDRPQQTGYMHGLNSDHDPHHGKITLNSDTLTAETLEVLSAGGAQ